MGFLSILDDDIDLLSEVIICLNYLGEPVPAYWKSLILTKQNDIVISFEQTFKSALNNTVDDYHVYFVLNWCLLTMGESAFTTRFNSKTPSFKCNNATDSILTKLSLFTHSKIMNGTVSVSYTHLTLPTIYSV